MNNPKFGTIFWWLLVVFFLIWIRAQYGKAQTLVRANHDAFTSYYDVETHNPALVCYVLEASHFAGVNKVASNRFKMDTKLPRPRIKDDDYKNWSYVRGHLCSAGDRDSNKKWLKETYLTSNLVPMTMYCNAGAWRRVEDSCRAVAMQGHRLKVCRLPLYDRYPDGSRSWDTSQVRDSPGVLLTAITSAQRVIRPAVPSAFMCLAGCLDCNVRLSLCVTQSGTYYAPVLAHGVSQTSVGLDNVIQSPDMMSGSRGFLCDTISMERKMFQETSSMENVIQFMNDPRVSVLLHNILGAWSREEYETITR